VSDAAKVRTSQAIFAVGIAAYGVGIILLVTRHWGWLLGLSFGGGFVLNLVGGFVMNTASREYLSEVSDRQWALFSRWGYLVGKPLGGWDPKQPDRKPLDRKSPDE